MAVIPLTRTLFGSTGSTCLTTFKKSWNSFLLKEKTKAHSFFSTWRMRPEEKVAHSGQHNCFCRATHTQVCHPGVFLPPSCGFSITGWLGFRDDGWGHRGALSVLVSRPACHRHAPSWPSIWSRHLSNPHPIKWRCFRLKEKQETRKEKKQDRKSEEEMENKLFTLTANAPQRVVGRKRGANFSAVARAHRRDVWAPGWGRMS